MGGSAPDVLKMFNTIHVLEKSLSDPPSDLSSYLSVLKRLEEALIFLVDNYEIAIQWLGNIVDYLENNKGVDFQDTEKLKKWLYELQQINNEKGHLDGGLLGASLDKLENEFQRLLMEITSPSPLPVDLIKKVEAVLGALIANSRLENCLSIYVDVRILNVRDSLKALDLDYLEISISKFDDLASIEYIAQWSRHLEFSVKHIFDPEYKLCHDVFWKMGLDVSADCFSRIASQAGIQEFLQFGKAVTESKNDPDKLLKLLNIFASFNKLRLDFNRLFGGAACAEIQYLTRGLIKRVIEVASEIFWEPLAQVELQKNQPPPCDGGVTRLVRFLPGYCNKLLRNDYEPILTQILVIHRDWKHEKFEENFLINEILKLIGALEQNLESWAKAYDDAILSHFFMMNNNWYLYKHVKGTKVGGLLSDTWLREHEQHKEYYSVIFLRESWDKLPALLSKVFSGESGQSATGSDLVKERLKAFNQAFEDMYKKQSNWVIVDRYLRKKTTQLLVQNIVPVYRSYIQNYVQLSESANKYVIYTAESLEGMLMSLFKPKLLEPGSLKSRQMSGTLDNGITDHYQSPPAAV